MLNREQAKEALYDLFQNDDELFTGVVRELDNYNGFLNGERCEEMARIDEFFSCASDILEPIFYGRDADNGGEFCPNREYFYFDCAGTLTSTDYEDYSDKLDDDFLEEIINNEYNICLPYEVQKIIDDIGEEEEEEEEE